MEPRPTFEDVYKSELTNVVNLATYFLGSRALAEEAAHDAFLKLHTNWSNVDNPVGFVKTATANRCKDLIKMNQRSRTRLRRVASPEVESFQNPYLVDVLQKLEPKRRFILVMRFYGGFKVSQIAEAMEIPVGTVESNLSRGLSQLKKMMLEEVD